MIVTLIVVCEVGFWVLLAAGLFFRYGLRMRRTGLALLLLEPLLEVVLLVATAVDLDNGADPSWKHGLAALYIGYTVGHGHRTVKWLDGHAAHRLAGAAPPVKPPRHGMARARHEARIWLGTVVAAAVAGALLLIARWYVGDPARTGSLESWILVAWRAAGIHGLIALSYAVWPKKAPREDQRPSPAPDQRDVTDALAGPADRDAASCGSARGRRSG
ncbi:hypothetical protein [Streptomyces chromofuscus]|uniref:hypothetical protein n=1 Tax=Streptomyces chromofuscus TaxID=42881 RepID=UPI00199DD41C|nr:hypothetical protein [Streptomyces chromofuscus]GGT35948.1 hypothetical protein GCM10010254_65300 [Streptomyces chromofuscus]